MQDLLPKAERVARALIARKQRIAVSESSSGGLVSAALLAVPGASAYFVSGAVTYTQRAREGLLGVGDAEMQGLRSSSPPYAMMLARRLVTRFGAEWGLVETGAAGPGGNRYGDAAGHCCLAVAGPHEHARTIETAHGGRVANMQAFAAAALDLMAEALETGNPVDEATIPTPPPSRP